MGDMKIPAENSEAWLAEKTKVLSFVSMSELLESGIIPKKFADCLEYNNALNSCCRNISNMRARLFKSHEDLPHPDIFVATCKCGRNHIRVRADPVRYGVNHSHEEKLAAATSILHQPYNSGVKYDETG